MRIPKSVKRFSDKNARQKNGIKRAFESDQTQSALSSALHPPTKPMRSLPKGAESIQHPLAMSLRVFPSAKTPVRRPAQTTPPPDFPLAPLHALAYRTAHAGGIQPDDTRTSGGAIAQLGERLNGIQEVSGSIPLGSTKTTPRSLGSIAGGLSVIAWDVRARPADRSRACRCRRRLTGSVP